MRATLLAVGLLLVLAAPAGAAPRLIRLGDFDQPTYATSPPTDQRIFVVEKRGTIRLVGGGTFLDISSLVKSDQEERGLLSMAFSPRYATDGLFYVFYTDSEGDIRVVEYRRSANPNVADPGSARPIFFAEHTDQEFHNGGQLQFGPDGALYASLGDRQDGDNAQDTSSNPYGKILRLDRAGGYTIWSYGLRNPWRFSFDRSTGDIAIGDVGETSWEEIDWGAAPGRAKGANFGWPDSEGFGSSGGRNPILARNHSEGFCAIIGGYVVRDPGLPTLNGRYVYGDFCNERIWSALPRTGQGNRTTGLTVSNLSSFGQDSCGHLYATSLAGPVYRIQDGALSSCNGAPVDRTRPNLAVRLYGARKALSRHRLRVAVECSERCAVTISPRLRDVRRLRTRHRDLAARQRTLVTLKLDKRTIKRLRKRLRRHRFVRAVVTVRATDAAGNSTTVTRRARIRRRS